ncbi:MAG TPA: hypothetical protein VKT80_07695, partial [Chloroflexota bacterium]|nr:hypothetical protein [Chloroflexota bacterium]
FTATAKDQFGTALAPQPTFNWSVNAGGAISGTGLFTAGSSAGGPFTVTASAGGQSGNASVNVSSATVTMGETKVLPTDDNGNGNFLIAQQTSLAKPATIQSLSFYVANAAGKLRLGVYDASGPSGRPGAKKAETAEITPTTGWNTATVLSPISLPAGTYWLAYFGSSDALGSRVNGAGNYVYVSLTYGALPATFPTNPTRDIAHWSFYATLLP